MSKFKFFAAPEGRLFDLASTDCWSRQPGTQSGQIPRRPGSSHGVLQSGIPLLGISQLSLIHRIIMVFTSMTITSTKGVARAFDQGRRRRTDRENGHAWRGQGLSIAGSGRGRFPPFREVRIDKSIRIHHSNSLLCNAKLRFAKHSGH